MNRIHADPFENNLFQAKAWSGPVSFHWCGRGGGSRFVSGKRWPEGPVGSSDN